MHRSRARHPLSDMEGCEQPIHTLLLRALARRVYPPSLNFGHVAETTARVTMATDGRTRVALRALDPCA